MKKQLFIFLIAPALVCAFDEKPWFHEPLEMRLDLLYSYSFFSKVNHSIPSSIPHFHENLQRITYGVAYISDWDFQLEIETAETTFNSGYFRSGGLLIRYQWLDDVIGDVLSVAAGLSLRGAPQKALKDITTPYARTFNIETTLSIGKEWDKLKDWKHRLWGLIAFGIGNKYSPWLRSELWYHFQMVKDHELFIAAHSYVGLGKVKEVVINHFSGWGKIQHRSIDVDIGYRYQLGIWGYLEAHYLRRVFAKSYPEEVNTFVISYHLPFSAI